MDGGFLYVAPLFDLVFNALIVLYRLLGEDLGLALIGIAVLSRLIVLPFTARQLKNVEKNKEFQEKYEELKKKYKNNQEKQTQEMAKLQAEYLPGQLSGCLTIILQLLLLIQINHVIRNLFKFGAEGFNTVAYSFVDKFEEGYEFSLTFLGGSLNLAQSAQDQGVTNLSESWPYLLLAAFLVGTQFFSMKILSGLTKDPKKEAEKKEKAEKAKKQKKKGKKQDEDDVPSFSEVFQDTNRQMMMFFPLLLGFFSLNYPSGLSLYFATTSFFVIIQQGITKRKQILKNIREKYFVEQKEVSQKSDEKESQTHDELDRSNQKSKRKKAKQRKRKSKKNN